MGGCNRHFKDGGDHFQGCVRRRSHETALTRLRTGHTRLTHGYLMSRGVQPYCDDCLVPLTVRHLLVECPSLGDLRERYLSNCRGVDGTFRLSLMLGEMCHSPGHEVIVFMEKAGFSICCKYFTCFLLLVCDFFFQCFKFLLY